jgi:hypothetical protein
MDFDKLLTSLPVNKQAAMHLAKNGEHYNPTRNVAQRAYSDLEMDALPIRDATTGERQNPSFTDLTGFEWGRFKVVGLLDCAKTGVGTGNGGGARWVCRCACGQYEVRQTKVVRRADPDNGACATCQYQRDLKAGKVDGVMPKLRNGAA